MLGKNNSCWPNVVLEQTYLTYFYIKYDILFDNVILTSVTVVAEIV